MRSIRKLYFQNAAGERRGLNGENGIFATDLSGFGYTLAPGFADLGHGFFSPVDDDHVPQHSLAFTLVLTRSAYTAHQSLVDWIAAAGTLTVIYNPTGRQEYSRDVSVNFLQKGELEGPGWLRIPCSFLCHTPWYLPRPTALSMSSSGGNNTTRYSYRYTKNLRYGADSAAAIRATIAGTGHIPGALRLTFRGAVTNPQIRLTGNISGRTHGVCRLSAILTETDTLIFSTRYRDSYVKRINAEGQETDLLDALDLSLEPFFRIPVNEPCTLSVEADTAFSARAELLVYYYFRSV